MFIGNGGSAAIASHMTADYSKNGGIRAVAFNDASLLTCLSNDFGYARVREAHRDDGAVLWIRVRRDHSPHHLPRHLRSVEGGTRGLGVR
jgi:hypothetical protein